MLKNYFLIAWRNLSKMKGYSSINIGGLSVGMAVAILIGLWIYDELSFNYVHKNYNTVAQVLRNGSFNGEGFTSQAIMRPLEFELRNKYGSNFKHIVMSRWDEDHILTVGETKITQTGKFMQEAAPEMLSLKMLRGNWKGLKDPYSIMLSASTAKALFGDTDPMNKVVKLDNNVQVKVTGVYEDLPHNSEFSHIKFFSTWELTLILNKWMKEAKDNWGNQSFLMYVQIHPNTTFETVSQRIKNAVQDNVDKEEKKFNVKPFLHPMSKWHLYSEWKNGVNVGGRIQFVWMFGIIGVFVLLLACINFMNLSTARSEKRAKEVGVRKAIGSVREQLIKQFLSESFLVVLIAFFFALFLVALSLPLFNTLADKKMDMMWSNPIFWGLSILFILFTGLLAGSYPAFYLSSFNAVKVLKGTFKTGKSASLPRQVLVVLQFTVSVTLIAGTIIVYRQIQHAKNRPVGYTREGLLMIHIKSDDLNKNFDILYQELREAGVTQSMSKSSSPLTGVWSNNGGFEWKDKDPNKVEGFGTIQVTHDHGKTVGWKFKAGRDFSRNFASDSVAGLQKKDKVYSIVINEAAARYMDLKNPVGEIIKSDEYPLRIIGVIEDMVMESPFAPVRQTIYAVDYENASSWINIKINPNLSASEALSKIEGVFKEIVPAVPFDYKFADTEYNAKFSEEERIGQLSSVFAGLAVLISCLGLFGLASFVAEKRTKEIGIRKVLGASVFNLWRMLSKDFLILVFIASFIAIPVAWYFLDEWLDKYEYRTEISWWIFGLVVGGVLIITVLTVSFQAIKAAMMNPVKSLRSE